MSNYVSGSHVKSGEASLAVLEIAHDFFSSVVVAIYHVVVER